MPRRPHDPTPLRHLLLNSFFLARNHRIYSIPEILAWAKSRRIRSHRHYIVLNLSHLQRSGRIVAYDADRALLRRPRLTRRARYFSLPPKPRARRSPRRRRP